jgi:multiple sugar transport system ATP-binding protein
LFEAEGVKLELGPAHAKLVGGSGEAEVTLGLRPEDLEERPAHAGAGEAWAQVEGTVEGVEPLGHEVLMHLKVGEATVTARLGARATGEYGAKKTLVVQPSRAHFFDARDGRRLG